MYNHSLKITRDKSTATLLKRQRKTIDKRSAQDFVGTFVNTLSQAASPRFTSLQDGIYALGKAHMRSTPSLSQKFLQRCL